MYKQTQKFNPALMLSLIRRNDENCDLILHCAHGLNSLCYSIYINAIKFFVVDINSCVWLMTDCSHSVTFYKAPLHRKVYIINLNQLK